jgi:hypothetical protein
MAATTENVVIDEVANGPEDIGLDWASIDWRQVEADVRRLRQRIFRASHATDPCKIRTYVLSPSHDLSWAVEQVDAKSARRVSYTSGVGPAARARGRAASPRRPGFPIHPRRVRVATASFAHNSERAGRARGTAGSMRRTGPNPWGNVMIHAARRLDLTQRL